MWFAERSAGDGNNMLELQKIYVPGRRHAKQRVQRLQKVRQEPSATLCGYEMPDSTKRSPENSNF